MPFEQKDNTGSLFKNDRRGSDNHPNATGSAKINGVDYWVSAWTKKDKNGEPWQSLAFKRKEEAPAKQDRGMPEDMDSDIPF